MYRTLFRPGPVWNELIIMESTRSSDYKFITLAHSRFGRNRSTNSLIPVGVVLAVLTASFGVTGYSLTRDQIGYWAVNIVTGVPGAIPVIGSSLVELLRGSASVGQSTLTRFYSLQTFVLPLLTAVFMLMHFPMIRKQGISGPL
ncbi:hypothetical protein RD792_017889 [Penstemon davidsonii]|uniref:Cytochrome b/b6 N-terminal region profile domain-containing protein n=1 Tax=Penstemon davidsonii TaxID=160366 RepID=A0ABR0DWE3_9LAMI|nr:hypothetical protein RD792_017889 [Penstemon davidsonii]